MIGIALDNKLAENKTAMKHLLLCVFFTLTTVAQAQQPYFHLQSVSVNRADVLNDSVLHAYAALDLQNQSAIDVVSFNLNTLRWQRLGQINGLSAVPIDSFRRSADSIWFILPNGQVHYSANNGQSFQQATIPFSTTQTQSFQSFHRVFNGYLMRFSLSGLFHFYHSFNGVDWVHAGSVPSNNGTQRFSVVNDTILYTANGTEILRNTNGGRSFSGSGNGTGRFVPQNTNNFQAISAQLMFAWSNSETYRSSNGGQTWSLLTYPTPTPASGSLRIVFKNLNEGTLAYWPGGAFYTLDGGATLLQIPSPSGMAAPMSLRYMGNRLLNGTGLFMHYTSNYGQTWEILEGFNMGDILDIHFKGDLGLLVGEDGKFMVSTNGGHWFKAGTPTIGSADLTACHIINDTSMLVGNFGGSLFRSTNQGSSWTSAGGSANNTIYRIKSNQQGYVLVTQSTNARYSNDFGRTTTAFGTAQNATNMFDVLPMAGQMRFVRNENTEFRVFSLSFPILTNTSPVQISNFARTNEDLVDLKMATDQTGYILCRTSNEQFITYKTTNGGNSWTRQNGITSPIQLSRLGLKFQTFGAEQLAVGQYRWNQNTTEHNAVITSNDGGATWQTTTVPQPTGVSNFHMRSVHFFDLQTWWMGFRNNRLILTGFGSGSNPSSVQPMRAKVEKLLIYPNPATHAISLQLPDEPCTISLVDVQGRVCLQQQLTGGLQQLALDLTPGMYVLRAVGQQSGYVGQSRLVVR